MEPKVEFLVAYFNQLHSENPKKILTSYILSKLSGNNSLSNEKLDQIQECILKLREKNFFHMLGGYYENHSLIQRILNILNGSKDSIIHNYKLNMSLSVAKQLDASFSPKDLDLKKYSHEATFLLMKNTQIMANDFNTSCINFLRIFYSQNEVSVIILANQITHSLKELQVMTKYSVSTLIEGETYEDLILSKDCDDYFHKFWFSQNNNLVNPLLSQIELESEVLEEDLEEGKFIIDESCVKEEESTKSMISDITNKSSNISPGLPFKKKSKEFEAEILSNILQRSLEKPHRCIFETDFIIPRNFSNQNFKLKIVRGNISSKNSVSAYNNGYIRISYLDFQIEKEISISHQGVIKFGRKGGESDIYLGDLSYTQISRDQFNIEVRNDRLRIQCCSPLPKVMTAFRINEKPFFLENNHIVAFGRDDEYTFRILAISNKKEDKYVTFQKFSPKNCTLGEEFKVRLSLENPQIIGKFETLNSPTLNQYQIELGFETKIKSWYIKEKELSNIQSEFETFVYLFKFGDLLQKKSEFVEFQGGSIINCGNCYLFAE